MAAVSSKRSWIALAGANICNEAINDFRKVFHMFDLDNSNTIDPAEFAAIIELLGDERPTDVELQSIMRVACEVAPDAPPPTTLTLKQFLNFFAIYKQVEHPSFHQKQEDFDARRNDIFRVLDADASGSVSSHELLKVLTSFGMQMSRDEAQAMVDLASVTPGNTEVSRHDFYQVMNRVKSYKQHGRINPSFDSHE